jgi:hypothetical protein
MAQSKLSGAYVFSRQEMVAGCEFSPDGRFEFFYSYGAVDRTATGTYAVQGNTLTLKSDKEAGHDFTVTTQSKAGAGYTLQFDCQDKYLVSNIHCTFFTGGEKHEAYTNSNGEIHVAFPHVDKIYAQHELFPDVATLIKDEENKNNRFTLSLNPSLAQVSFRGIDLKIMDAETLACPPNYLIPLENITFKKQ